MVVHAYKHKTLKVRQEGCSKFDTSLNYGRKRLFHKTKQSITELVSAVHSLQSHAVSNVMEPLSALPYLPHPMGWAWQPQHSSPEKGTKNCTSALHQAGGKLLEEKRLTLTC